MRSLKWILLTVLISQLAACETELPVSESDNGVQHTLRADYDILLPAHQLPSEMLKPGKADASFDYKAGNPQWFAITEPPAAGTYRALVEWEPQAFLLTSYSNGIEQAPGVAQTLSEIVSETALTAGTQVGIVLKNPTTKNDLINRIKANGMTDASIEEYVDFIEMDHDTIWHIDFGPVPLVNNADGAIAFSDFRYYPGRHLDDSLPTKLGNKYGINTFRMPMDTEGGNFQADGLGNCFFGERGLQYAGMTKAELDQVWGDYLGCTAVHILKDITNDGTGHIDMFFKLSAETTSIMGDYDTQFLGGALTSVQAENKTRMDENTAMLEGVLGHTVLRMPFPQDGIDPEYGPTPRTFLNSTLVNNVNLWPIYTTDKVAEAAALQVWETALPDYTHVGIISDAISLWSGAIHCVTRTVPVGPMTKWIADGECNPTGTCDAPLGGYTGECNATIPCSGPEWLCPCFDCSLENCQLPEGADSCEGYCGAQNPAGCYCDELCSQYGDCCSDYEEICGGGGQTGGGQTGGGQTGGGDASCVGYCGGQNPEAGCYCDELCAQYGDCCADIDIACPDLAETGGGQTGGGQTGGGETGGNPETGDEETGGGIAGTCEGYCGTFNPEDECFCTSNCEEQFNCCADAEALCGHLWTENTSCEGLCGTSGLTGCKCDDKCVEYGDCCTDYDALCAAGQTGGGINTGGVSGIDANGDGVASEDEWDAGEVPFATVDGNGDGVVTDAEYNNFFFPSSSSGSSGGCAAAGQAPSAPIWGILFFGILSVTLRRRREEI